MRWMRCLVFASVLAVISAFTVSAQQETEHATGLVWDDIEVIDSKLRVDQWGVESVLPSSVDLTDSFPVPRNQGHQNSCTGWAIAYALKSHQEEAERDWGLDTDEHLFSPAYIYSQRYDISADTGMSIISALDVIIEQGVCTLASFPYNESDSTAQPTDEQKAEAAQFRVLDYYSIRGTDSLKRHLANGDGIVIGVEIYPDFDKLSESNPIYDNADGISRGGHAITLIGYSDEKQAFKFINSWGTSWGLDGCGWISYDLVNDINVSNYGEARGFVMVSSYGAAFTEDSFEYTVSDLKEATVIGYTGPGGNIVIPDTLGGYPVTAVGRRAFQDNTSVTGIVIPDSVTEIGGLAFAGTALTHVTIPDGVAELGESVFSNCRYLTGAVIPDSVTEIGEAAFSGCRALTDVTIPGSITNIRKDTFRNTGIVSVTIPESVTAIGGYAFYNCSELTSVVISGSPDSIGYGAFLDLPDNAVIYVPDMTTKTLVKYSGFTSGEIIAEKEFGTCGDNLAWELDKESGTLIVSGTGDMRDYTEYDHAPWYSLDIKRVSVGSGVEHIGAFAFDKCILVNEVVFGDNVSSIGKGAFRYCESLENAVLPNSVTDVGDSVFSGCISLTDVTISGNVKSIGDDAFYRCYSLTGIAVPDSVTSIGSRAFYDCVDLSSITIPNSVSSIDTMAFYGCKSLTELYLPDSVTYIGEDAFLGLGSTLKIYAADKAVRMLAVNSGFPADRVFGVVVESGICGENLTWTLDSEGILTISGTGSMYDYAPWYSCTADIKKLVIEEGVTAIGAGVFDDCRIESLVINMSEIDLTFADMAGLKNITLGTNVSSVPEGAFPADAAIYVPDQRVRALVKNSGVPDERILWTVIRFGVCGENLTWILDSTGTFEISGTGAMRGDALIKLTGDEKAMIKRIVIGSGITSIGDSEFYLCEELSDISIPDTVTYIDDLAFFGCVSLAEVFIPDSVTSIGLWAFADLPEDWRDPIVVPLPNLVISCNENSCAHDYAVENDIPFRFLDYKTIEVTPLINDIIVDSVTVTRTPEGLYDLDVNFEKPGDVFFVFAQYDGERLSKTYTSDNAQIKGITDIENGKIYIWDRNMRPCIKAVKI